MSEPTTVDARQVARDAGRERARLAAALATTASVRDAQKARHADKLDGLKGKERATTARALVAADKGDTLASLDGATVTVTLSLKRDAEGKISPTFKVNDILIAHDVTGAEIRLAVVGSLRVTDTVRVSVDALVS